MTHRLAHLPFFLLLSCLWYIIPCGAQSSPFSAKNRFSQHKNSGLEDFIGNLMGVADVNNDKLLDLVLLSENKSQLDFMTYNQKEKKFNFSFSLPFSEISQSGDVSFTAVNIAFGDFSGDGQQDLAIMGYDQNSKLEKLIIKLYKKSKQDNYVYATEIGTFNRTQPVLFDYGKKMLIDMLGTPYREEVGSDASPKLYRNLKNGNNDSSIYKISDFFSSSSSEDIKACTLANPHSSSFVDLDGDCLSDLFLVCDTNPPTYQIWINNKKTIGFTRAAVGELPKGTGQISFTDIDGNGSLDMVFPVCVEEGCEIHIVYNNQKPFCNTDAAINSDCRSLSEICTADPNFGFDISDENPHTVIKLEEILPGERLDLMDPSFEGPQPVQIQLGDLDHDGFPDLLITTISKTKNQKAVKRSGGVFSDLWDSLVGSTKRIEVNNNTKVRIFRNVLLPSNDVKGRVRRTFELIKDDDSIGEVQKINNPTRAVFFDMSENGTLDILVSYLDENKKPRLMVIHNNFDTASSFFMKASLSPELAENENKGDLPYMFGGIFKCILSSGNKRLVMAAAQYSQQGYRSMQQPFTFFGLGKLNNYVDKLYIGSTQGKVYNFESLIPNSRMFFRVNLLGKLKPTLLLPTANNSNVILLGLIITMVCLTGVIFVLNKLEREADLREKQNQLFWINFDAL